MPDEKFDKFLQQKNQGKKDNPITANKSEKSLSEAEKKQRKRRNIKVYDEAFYEVVALSQLKNMTQNELIRFLVKNAVNELQESEKSVFDFLRNKIEETDSQKKND